MSQTQEENTNLKTRAEKVRAFLRGPVAEYGLFATAIGGTLGTTFGTLSLAERMIDAGNPYASLIAGGLGGVGISVSLMMVRASTFLKDIFSENETATPIAKKDFNQLVSDGALKTGIIVGAVFAFSTGLAQAIAHHDKSDEARVASLPALDPNTVLPAKTAAQEFCKARDGGHTIVVNVTRPNGTPAEFRLACPK